MNNKFNYFSKILYVFLVIFCFSHINVYAEEQTIDRTQDLCSGSPKIPENQHLVQKISNSCLNYMCNNQLDTRYKANVDLVSGSYKISLEATAENAGEKREHSKVKFYLVDQNNNITNYVLSVGSPLFVPSNFSSSSDEMVLKFVIDPNNRPSECSAEDLAVPLSDGDVGSKLYLEIFYEEYADIISDPNFTPSFPPVSNTGQQVDCSNANGLFEQAFCKVKNDASTKKFTFDNGAQHTTTESFTCNSDKVFTSSQLSTSYYQPENTKYLYATGVNKLNFGTYKYHYYGPNNPKNGDTVSCKIKCEEAVEVEYGAPVASKAGLCFEYKVKVTSRVSCHMTEAPKEPKVKGVCTPAPKCTGTNSNGNSYVVTEGGPNDEFDDCIMSCDGGKYTASCSNKCYNKVYGDTLQLNYRTSKNYNVQNRITDANSCTTGNISSIQDAIDCNNLVYHGYYDYSGDTISWNKFDSQYAARWYFVSGYGGDWSGCRKTSRKDYDPIDGFCRRKKRGGSYCNDYCRWRKDCVGNDKYLNPYFAEADYVENKRIYDEAVSACQAAVRCSSNQATFTISVNYKNQSNSVQTIEFPYNVNPNNNSLNTLSSSSRDFDSFKNSSDYSKSPILQYSGCYGQSDTVKNLYFTEWGFPDSYINRKTGEISYNSQVVSHGGWSSVKSKFCVPFDAQDVNVKWWHYYYNKLGLNSCWGNKNGMTSYTPIDYNITASVKDFGYFGWDLQVKCFYALNNSGNNICKSSTTKDPDVKYVIPSRDAGFNWTSDAQNTELSNYKVSPESYARKVQNDGYSIYSENELDYYFDLDVETLRKLNDQNIKLFDGGKSHLSSETKLFHYKSDLIRSSNNGLNSDNWIFPDSNSRTTNNDLSSCKELVCNNIKNGGGNCE